MHVSPGWIDSTFEYLSRKSSTWSERDRLAGICCDEMYISPDTDIDLVLDMALNPKHKNSAHIFMVRSICSTWKFPFFCDVDYTFTKEDIYEALARFDVAGIEIVALTCDQGMYTVDNNLFLKFLRFDSSLRHFSCFKNQHLKHIFRVQKRQP